MREALQPNNRQRTIQNEQRNAMEYYYNSLYVRALHHHRAESLIRTGDVIILYYSI